MTIIDDMLHKTSRTFALAIPLLPEPTRTEVGVAYLLFRVADSFEDGSRWDPARRIQALRRFTTLLDGAAAEDVQDLMDECAADPPLGHVGYLELLQNLPVVLGAHARLQPEARALVRTHVERSARGMESFLARSDEAGILSLQTINDLRDYCYAVAGIVGEMLTELFLLGRPGLEASAAPLRERAARFGEALQLVNILKDAHPDADEGRIYLPRQVGLPEVFALAAQDLNMAAEYTEALKAAGAERGLVAFNALIMQLAVATLRVLRKGGLGTKLTRREVMGVVAAVARSLDTGEPLVAAGL
jgi:farnesyl-diphosphate farnesyltransferase